MVAAGFEARGLALTSACDTGSSRMELMLARRVAVLARRLLDGSLREIQPGLTRRFGVDAWFEESLSLSISTSFGGAITASPVNSREQININAMGP